jgi:hypothetical protein
MKLQHSAYSMAYIFKIQTNALGRLLVLLFVQRDSWEDHSDMPDTVLVAGNLSTIVTNKNHRLCYI